MAYDTGRGYSIFFGGLGASTNGPVSLADTWTFTGSTWTQISPSTVPPARFASNMVYDSAHAQSVMFGGASFTNNGIIFPFNDTWAWNGSNWIQKLPATVPGYRYYQGMAYDSARNQTVMFGGVSSATYLAETWVYDGTNWTQKFPAHSPPARMAPGMAFDPIRNVTVMFGGVNTNGDLGDTWVWDGSDWTQKFPATNPIPRYGPALAYDPTFGKSLMFGGNSANGNYQDTWLWDGTNWVGVTPATIPAPRFFACIVFDASQSRIVLWGGGEGLNVGDIYLNDTWFYQ